MIVQEKNPSPLMLKVIATCQHEKYASEATRLESFKNWPSCLEHLVNQLVDAGFFYVGDDDETICFYCGGGLKDWETDDVPWEQHAIWFNRCFYVYHVKGADYVKSVVSQTKVIK